jgi:hypothetical protein
MALPVKEYAMRCQRCQRAALSRDTRQVSLHGARIQACESCGATILVLDGVPLGVGQGTLARLARFGLALGEPLLEPREHSD